MKDPDQVDLLSDGAVADIVERNVVTVEDSLSLAELAGVLRRHEISGAPVVDAEGYVVGVISQSDITWALSREAAVEPGPSTGNGPAPSAYFRHADGSLVGGPLVWSPPPGARTVGRRVADVMMHARFSVGPDTSIPELADFLIRHRIHRALIMDGDRLVGIVTAFDVLRVIAQGRRTPART